MTTILPIGTTVCQACRAPVAVVRRTFVFLCKAHGPRRRLCTSESLRLTVVDESGERHRCAA